MTRNFLPRHLATAIALAGAWAGVATLAPAASAAQGSRAIAAFEPSVPAAERARIVRSEGGRVVRDLHLIDGLGIVTPRAAAIRLAHRPGVRSVTPDAAVRTSAVPAATGAGSPAAPASAGSAAPAAPAGSVAASPP